MMAHIGIVAAGFYRHILDMQLAGARAALKAAGATHEAGRGAGRAGDSGAIGLATETGRYDGFVALGCVIRGRHTISRLWPARARGDHGADHGRAGDRQWHPDGGE